MTWREILAEAQRHHDADWWGDHHDEVVDAFRMMLRSNPSREDFALYLRDVRLLPEMLYVLWTEPPPDRAQQL
jgi:hypothetical protein